MSVVEVNVSKFRAQFPEFDSTKYPDTLVNRFIIMAEAYCSTTNYRIRPAVRELLIELMTAHLITLVEIDPTTHTVTSSGGIAGFEVSASIDGVSVSKQAPIAKNAFEQWIQSTGYGQQYWALLVANVPTPIHWIGTPRAFGIK